MVREVFERFKLYGVIPLFFECTENCFECFLVLSRIQRVVLSVLNALYELRVIR